ncbi:hypothetical protein EVAR_7077_1 [Eumeta japonica]|uniref:Uncharacterized protein n=1 Tax=Eumeta variegata TaxID=151549 RepID=A0A4C1XCB7_EUMVA|nr:hypothetical protein EVAR_7077_1 [Eumeta japonica]
MHEGQSRWPTPFSTSPLPLYRPVLRTIRYSIPTREAGNALMTALESRVSMRGGGRLLSCGSCALLPLEIATEKNQIPKNSKLSAAHAYVDLFFSPMSWHGANSAGGERLNLGIRRKVASSFSRESSTSGGILEVV